MKVLYCITPLSEPERQLLVPYSTKANAFCELGRKKIGKNEPCSPQKAFAFVEYGTRSCLSGSDRGVRIACCKGSSQLTGINPTKAKRQCSHIPDSKSMELVLKSSKINSTAMLLVMDLIVKVKKTCSFDIRWIKGHFDNKGQELADGLSQGRCQGKPTNKDH